MKLASRLLIALSLVLTLGCPGNPEPVTLEDLVDETGEELA